MLTVVGRGMRSSDDDIGHVIGMIIVDSDGGLRGGVIARVACERRGTASRVCDSNGAVLGQRAGSYR